MAKEFNVPPVVFPSGGNPGPQQRRLPTAPFQPPKSLNPGIPFMSFDVGSAAASTSFSTPQFASTTIGGGGSMGFEDEPPLLEELGINTKQIYQKTISIMNPFRVKADLHEDADLSGPFILLMAFGLFQFWKASFWNHFGMGSHGFVVSLCSVQHARRQKWEFGFVQVCQPDWLLYVAYCDFVGDLIVFARRIGDQGGGRSFCDMVYQSLH